LTSLQDAQPEVGPGTRGRITVYCVSDSLDREMLDKRLQQRGPQFLLHSYPDALYGKYSELEHGIVGDVLYFDYGVVVFWGLSKKQEQDVLKNLVAPCQEAPLPAAKAARDEFQYNYAANEKAHIQNDTVTIDYRLSRNHMIKIAISHALAQSTKLVHFEARVLDIISNTKNLPEHLANTGEILLSKKQIAQLIGTVFIEKSRVNLLSTVLDTPEFFWDAPDSMQTLYERVCEYMELEERVRVLNNRYQVLTEMLDVLRDHQNNSHSAALEWIVIWLIVVCLLVCLSALPWLGGTNDAPSQAACSVMIGALLMPGFSAFHNLLTCINTLDIAYWQLEKTNNCFCCAHALRIALHFLFVEV